MIDDKYRKYEPFFGKWRISKELGSGSFGRVFEIYWEDDLGSTSKSALKIIHIPSEESLRIQMEEQPNMDAVRNYFLKQVDRIKEEIRILQRCKGHSNIVSYEDHMIVEDVGENKIGWDILIRMELLYPLNPYFSRNDATQYDIVQMWLDIASALIYCEEQNIIHRDIKPANILRSGAGRYKLSDFGVARKTMQATEASTRVGTERYMAPEVFKNQKYDRRADYYSLGCVIYYFLNKRRHVFLPPYPQEVDSEDSERAEKKRINGEKIPRIKGVSKEVNDVLIKSMAYKPAGRYRSARELYRAIQNILEMQGNDLRQRYLNDAEADINFVSTRGRGSSKLSNVSRKPVSLRIPSGSRTPVNSRVPDSPVKTDAPRKTSSSKMIVPVAAAGMMLVAGIGGIIYGVSLKNEQGQRLAINQEVNSLENHTDHVTEPNEMPEGSGIPLTEEATSLMRMETEKPVETENLTEAETETEKPVETENLTEAETETEKPVETENPTEAETETETETETEKPTETETETEKPTETETETEKPTEAETETETETETEKPTEAEAETEKPTETETETEKPVPAMRVLGELERPAEGDTIEAELKIKGWVLTNDTIGDIEIYVDILSGGKTVETFTLKPETLGENTFEKRQKKYAEEIAAAKGYEVKESCSVEGIPDGAYDLQLRIVDKKSGWENVLETVPVNISGTHAKRDGDVLEFMGLTEEPQDLDTHYIYKEKGFAIGMDTEEGDTAVLANADQILLTGWINAKEGTSLGMYFDIDSELYTADMLAQRGGEFSITRVPRNLEKMDASLTGSSVLDTEEAGYIVSLKLPFLEEGTHTIAISFNVGVPGAEPELVDIKPLTIEIDPAEAVRENAVEQITKSWEAEFPRKTETESSEPEKPQEETGE